MSDNQEQFKQKLDRLKKALVSIGFSLDEAENQIEKVGKIVSMAIIERLIKEIGQEQSVTPDNLEQFLKDNFTPQYLKQAIERESGKIVSDYINTITQNLSEDQKQKFFNQIQQV